jgi:hypothetical protein
MTQKVSDALAADRTVGAGVRAPAVRAIYVNVCLVCLQPLDFPAVGVLEQFGRDIAIVRSAFGHRAEPYREVG